MADVARLMRETVGSEYYRAHPMEALRFTKAKFAFRRSATTPDDILSALGFDILRSRAGLENWADELGEVLRATADAARDGDEQAGVSLDGALLAYGVVRCLRPDLVIETGVAAGVSSSFILAALAENGHGRLIAIDLPPGRMKCADGSPYDWIKRPVGWAVPRRLRELLGDRYTLVLEDVRTALPRILEQEPHVDVFVHDDLHLPDHMRWEYDLVWPKLRAGGVLLSDDVNQGWLGFGDEIGQRTEARRNVRRFGAMRKPVP